MQVRLLPPPPSQSSDHVTAAIITHKQVGQLLRMQTYALNDRASIILSSGKLPSVAANAKVLVLETRCCAGCECMRVLTDFGDIGWVPAYAEVITDGWVVIWSMTIIATMTLCRLTWLRS